MLVYSLSPPPSPLSTHTLLHIHTHTYTHTHTHTHTLPYTHTDVQFWRNRKSLEGLSVRSVFFNVFQSFVVLLYILDNETNYVIIVSVFIGECFWPVPFVIIHTLDELLGIPLVINLTSSLFL